MMLMSKHCSIYVLRCQTKVIAFTLLGTIMLLLIDLTSVPEDKSIGIEYCQKSIADTHIDTAYEKYHRH